MKQPKIVRELPCDMTDEERLLKADQLAKQIDKLRDLEDSKKEFNAANKQKKDTTDTACRLLAIEVRTGKETRPIECYESRDFDHNMVNLIRTDTHAVVESRPMHPSERQAELGFNAPAQTTEGGSH